MHPNDAGKGCQRQVPHLCDSAVAQATRLSPCALSALVAVFHWSGPHEGVRHGLRVAKTEVVSLTMFDGPLTVA